jgi:hypothetical protein
MKTFKGWNGGGSGEGDTLSLGTLEGSGAPMLHITDEFANSTSFVFMSPGQVDELIEALLPFGKGTE